jgi:RNA polymerase-binding transcription factor DksA
MPPKAAAKSASSKRPAAVKGKRAASPKKPAPPRPKAKAKTSVPARKTGKAKAPAPAKPKVGARAPAPGKAKEAKETKPNGAKTELTAWHRKQRQKLIELRDSMLDAMDGVARDTLRARPEGSEASAFGMHQADAGSDAYDRDFALSMLSKEQDALYEIEEALRRIDNGSYGICEMSHKKIPQMRLDAIPFARYTVECQAQLEKENRGGYGRRPPVRSLFGLGGEEGDEEEGEGEGSPTPTNAESND